MLHRKNFSKFFLFAIAAIAFTCTQALAAAERQVVVAASGGDYTTIQDALAAINPTTSDPYVIDVMPGTYYLNEVTMKSNVHLRGAGSNTTNIYAYSYPSRTSLIGDGLSNVRISGFRFYNGTAGVPNAMGYGIVFTNADNIVISNNKFEGLYIGVSVSGAGKFFVENNVFVSGAYPINYNDTTAFIHGNDITGASTWAIKGGGPAMISGNNIHDLNGGQSIGMYILSSNANTSIVGNTIRNAGIGIECQYCADITIQGNTIADNLGYGVFVYRASPTFLQNRITGNGTGGNPTIGETDVGLSQSTFKGSFNVYDSISGSGAMSGAYNVTSDGQPAPTL
jgi:parallel beta-helix repeat protein